LGGVRVRLDGKGELMANRNEVVAEQLAELRQDLRDLWVALTADPKKQARKERAWSLVAGAVGAIATIGARRVATKLWGVLTGEEPPPVQQAREDVQEVQRPEPSAPVGS
jgi:hypothetical protein